MGTSLDEVIETVRAARDDGPEALAAMALSYGATMVLGAIGNRALRGRIAEMREAQTAADEMRDEMRDALRHERDAACAELKHALESTAETRAEVWRLRESVAALRAERDEARNALATAGKIAAEAVREREAFALRLSAVERERDEARAERDTLRARPTYAALPTMPTPEERAAHLRAGARWLRATPHHVSITHLHRTGSVEHLDGATWIPLGADGLPCAWPVAGEVTL